MVKVSKCCCCFNLKYGYYTYGIMCLLFRICAIGVWHNVPYAIGMEMGEGTRVSSAVLPGVGSFLGWFIASSAIIFLCLKGIVEHKSHLIFPCIVLFFLELIGLFISGLILMVLVSPWLIPIIIIEGSINIYALICLMSLYQDISQLEGNIPHMALEEPKVV